MPPVVIGTRGSALALWQARHVASLLEQIEPGLQIEERVVRTEGDADRISPIADLGATGVFVRTLERELAAGTIDLAVHSMKDLPSERPTGLVLAAIPRRADPRDALVTIDGAGLADLPRGARVGTGSVRRRCQLLHARPDLRVEPMRGNVDTRLGRLRDGELDAVVLACAGLERLGVRDVCVTALEVRTSVPAVGQGALAVEVRLEDRRLVDLLAAIHHAPSGHAVRAERAVLRRMSGGCQAPAGAHAWIVGDALHLLALVGEPDGSAILMQHETGPIDQGEEIGRVVAERLAGAGAARILSAARSTGDV